MRRNRKSPRSGAPLTWFSSAKENLLTAELILPTFTENVKLGQPRHFSPIRKPQWMRHYPGRAGYLR